MRRTLISICVLQAFSPFTWAEVAPTEQTSLESASDHCVTGTGGL